jgi:hypothetical protein
MLSLGLLLTTHQLLLLAQTSHGRASKSRPPAFPFWQIKAGNITLITISRDTYLNRYPSRWMQAEGTLACCARLKVPQIVQNTSPDIHLHSTPTFYMGEILDCIGVWDKYSSPNQSDWIQSSASFAVTEPCTIARAGMPLQWDAPECLRWMERVLTRSGSLPVLQRCISRYTCRQAPVQTATSTPLHSRTTSSEAEAAAMRYARRAHLSCCLQLAPRPRDGEEL